MSKKVSMRMSCIRRDWGDEKGGECEDKRDNEREERHNRDIDY